MAQAEKAKIGAAVTLFAVFVGLVIHRLPELREIRAHHPFCTGPQEPLFEKDGVLYLRGGSGDSDHFDVSEFDLEPDQLYHGVGREAFAALIAPEFVTAGQADAWLVPAENVLAVRIGDDVEVYPIPLLIRHEVVNDVVGGHPIFAAYCILANLGAVYDRELNNREYTFALSGYTYRDEELWEGRNAFVLWDRETERLWWPPIGRAVSGLMRGTPMKLLDRDAWSQTTWDDVRSAHPEALVLNHEQQYEPPRNWPRYNDRGDPDADGSHMVSESTPPHWGENAELAGSQSAR